MQPPQETLETINTVSNLSKLYFSINFSWIGLLQLIINTVNKLASR
jgi:hypothetical protein